MAALLKSIWHHHIAIIPTLHVVLQSKLILLEHKLHIIKLLHTGMHDSFFLPNLIYYYICNLGDH